MAEEKIVRWKVVDPRGIEIVMYDEIFNVHLIGEHNSKDASFRGAIEPSLKKTLQHPTLILKDPDFKNRSHYYRADLVGLGNFPKKVKTVKVVVEDNDGKFDVVTWGAQNRLQGEFYEEDIIYED